MNINIVTIFDKNYIVRTLAFYDALCKVEKECIFWFACMDQETKHIMSILDLPRVKLFTIEDMGDTELLGTKSGRSYAEFVFTSKSAAMHYVMNKIPDGDALVFSDNDVIYFSSPKNILNRIASLGKSIAIVPHRFPKEKEYMNERVGRYNAGLVYFIAGENSRLCIRDWRKECVNWCYLKYENGRFGDQLYMNAWPEKYTGVYEIPDKGVNVGSWSLSNWKVSKKEGIFYIDESLLVCYHYHRIKFYIDGNTVKPLPIYIFHDELYQAYTAMLQYAWDKMHAIEKNWPYGFIEKPGILRLWKQRVTRLVRKIKGTQTVAGEN